MAGVVIRPDTCGATASRPGSQYEEHRLPGHPRALGFYAQTKSPGRICALSRRQPFSRRQAVGVVAYLNTGTLTAVQFLGAVLRPLRSPSFLHCALQPAKQARSGFTDVFQVLFCMFAHDEQHEGVALKCPTRVL